jgi:hypothetical protein
MAIGTIELLSGSYLLWVSKYFLFKHQDVSIAETYFILVFINVIGGILYWTYYPAYYYDNMSLTMMIIQIIILAWRVFKDGKLVGRCCLLFPIFGSAVANINKRHSFLQAKKIKSKEAKET